VSAIDPLLVRDVDLLCLDAGNTVVFLDHARLATACASLGFVVSAKRLIEAEGVAKRSLEEGTTTRVEWSLSAFGAARSWAAVMATTLHSAGLALGAIPVVLEALWEEHRATNFWSLVPPGTKDALDRLRVLGVRVAVVSNSEGMLANLFDDLGLSGAFDLVLDSGVIGIEKPDVRIFRLALDRFAVPPERTLHLGDTFATDVVGARAARIRVALVDPFGHFDRRHQDVPRVPGAPQVAEAIAEARVSA
jgi:putative hydrolase of the HAD superfamily